MTYEKDLTNQYISESFQRLLQISGSDNVVLDGTGSLKSLRIDGTISASSFEGTLGFNIIPNLFEIDPDDTGSIRLVEITGSNLIVTDPHFYLDVNGDAVPRPRLFDYGDLTVGGHDFYSGSYSGSFTGDGSGLSNIPGVSNQYELELQLKDSQRSYYKALTFTDGNLSTSSLWDSSAMGTLVFDQRLTYASGQLTQSVVTRYSDNKTLTKIFYYSGGNLANINVTEA